MELQDRAPVAYRADRQPSIDALRGLVMVIMALDHTRDFFSGGTLEPGNLATTTPAYFFTRWITHCCAPVFVFLAGASSYFFWRRSRSTSELSRFLWTRGLWLIVLEFTVIRWGWNLNFDDGFFAGMVIWAIGVSLIVLALYPACRWYAALKQRSRSRLLSYL
jgi:uncharacterized membrane protein